MGVIDGDPLFAAVRTSGPLFMNPRVRSMMPGFVRFSSSYFIRAAATGSASGTGISICFSICLASSARALRGYSFTMRE